MKFSRNCIFGSNWFMKTIFGALDTWARSVFKIRIFMAEKFLPATTWWAKMWLFLTFFFSIYDQNVSKYGVIMSRTQIKSLWTVCLAKFDRRKVSLFFSYLQNIGLISRHQVSAVIVEILKKARCRSFCQTQGIIIRSKNIFKNFHNFKNIFSNKKNFADFLVPIFCAHQAH